MQRDRRSILPLGWLSSLQPFTQGQRAVDPQLVQRHEHHNHAFPVVPFLPPVSLRVRSLAPRASAHVRGFSSGCLHPVRLSAL